MTDRLTVKDDGFATTFPLPHPSFPLHGLNQEEMDGTSTMTLRFPFARFSSFQGGTNYPFGIVSTVLPCIDTQVLEFVTNSRELPT